MVKRAPPTAHISNVPLDDVRQAMAMDILLKEQIKSVTDRRKRARSGFEAKGISLKRLDWLIGLKDETGSAVIQMFREMWHYVGATFKQVTDQYDLFAEKPTAEESHAAHYHLGLMAGMTGKAQAISPAMDPGERDMYLKGFNDGAAARKKAEQEILGGALEAKDGKPTDGTAAAVTAKAAADFAKDQGEDPLVVNGERYPNMRAANAARKRAEKEAAEAPPPPPDGPPASEDGFEATKEELDKQAGRKRADDGAEAPAP